MRKTELVENGNEYNDSAVKFLRETGTEMFTELAPDPIHWREYKGTKLPCIRHVVRLVRGSRQFEATFAGSIADAFRMLVGSKIPDRLTNHDMESIQRAIRVIGYNARIKPPSVYDFLACLQKYPCEDHADFCADFGYDPDSIKSRDTWIAVRDEYRMLAALYNESEMKKLQEIIDF